MRQKGGGGGGGEWYWSDKEQSWRFYDPDPSTRREGAFTNQELGSSQNFFIKEAEKKAKADAEHQKEIDKLIKKGRDVSSRPPNRQVVDDAFAKKKSIDLAKIKKAEEQKVAREAAIARDAARRAAAQEHQEKMKQEEYERKKRIEGLREVDRLRNTYEPPLSVPIARGIERVPGDVPIAYGIETLPGNLPIAHGITVKQGSVTTGIPVSRAQIVDAFKSTFQPDLFGGIKKKFTKKQKNNKKKEIP